MKVYDEGYYEVPDARFPFVVAEYLPITFSRIIHEISSLTEKVSYTIQLLSALTHLERLTPAIAHRDIKPQNIFIKGRACVLGDFGLMKKINGNDDLDREIYKESVGPGMPFLYRTPDLVAYAKNEGPLTIKTDVFQLGLVIAEIFTGKNPCKRSGSFLDPVELEPLGFIKCGLGGQIASLIRLMLTDSHIDRPTASALQGQWEKIFMDAVTSSHMLEGIVFH